MGGREGGGRLFWLLFAAGHWSTLLLLFLFLPLTLKAWTLCWKEKDEEQKSHLKQLQSIELFFSRPSNADKDNKVTATYVACLYIIF